MKDLELTAYPLDPAFPAGYKLPRDTRITFAAANRMAKEKRLTSVELAAEYWRYESNIWEALAKMPEPPTLEAVMAGEEWNRRAEIVERFATLPHADEVPE